MYFENIIALHLAIEHNKPPEIAFKILDKMLDKGKKFKFTNKFYNYNWTLEDAEDMQKLKKEGLSYGAIGELYGISNSATIHILKKYGLYKKENAYVRQA